MPALPAAADSVRALCGGQVLGRSWSGVGQDGGQYTGHCTARGQQNWQASDAGEWHSHLPQRRPHLSANANICTTRTCSVTFTLQPLVGVVADVGGASTFFPKYLDLVGKFFASGVISEFEREKTVHCECFYG